MLACVRRLARGRRCSLSEPSCRSWSEGRTVEVPVDAIASGADAQKAKPASNEAGDEARDARDEALPLLRRSVPAPRLEWPVLRARRMEAATVLQPAVRQAISA